MASRCRSENIRDDFDQIAAILANDSEDEYSNIGSDSFFSDCSENSDFENVPQTSGKRPRIGDLPLFQWKYGVFIPTVHRFDETSAGIKNNVFGSESKILDYFMHFFSPELVLKILQMKQIDFFFTYHTKAKHPLCLVYKNGKTLL